MSEWPKTLVFRQYGADGRPLPSGYVVEREAFDAEEKRSFVRELQASGGFELECVVPSSEYR